MQNEIVGRTLTGVTYHMLPNSEWRRSPGVHGIDFGLDLEFADSVLGVMWNDDATQALRLTPGSLRDELREPTEVDMGAVYPWNRAIGTVVSQVSYGEPHATASGGDCVWSIRISFGREVTLWLAAATYVEPPGLLVPCSDELTVISDLEVASGLGLT